MIHSNAVIAGWDQVLSSMLVIHPICSAAYKYYASQIALNRAPDVDWLRADAISYFCCARIHADLSQVIHFGTYCRSRE
jgi:hypothetical protein